MIKGAYALLVMTENTSLLPWILMDYVHYLLEGRRWVLLSSETCAFDVVGATYFREVEPGEMVIIDEYGIRSSVFQVLDFLLDLFFRVYLFC